MKGYDTKITFISEGSTADGYGGVTPSTTEVLTTWASITQLKSGAKIEQAQLEFPATFTVRVQCRAGFTPQAKNLITWMDKTYSIVSAPFVESTRYKKEWIFNMSERG